MEPFLLTGEGAQGGCWCHKQLASGRWGSAARGCCSSRGRNTLLPNLHSLVAIPIHGKTSRVNLNQELECQRLSVTVLSTAWQLMRWHQCQAVLVFAFPLGYIGGVKKGACYLGNSLSSKDLVQALHPGEDTSALPHGHDTTRDTTVTSYKSQYLFDIE